ncbi:hypothetical protein N7499_002221 [Penicillium canescens]|uniref:Uncharacterized protein n=1 Tax=Penicillium canescens TaxID=5083 RepID=A0AAD6N6F8_PENCN|nr:uncharacterized protein N7446_009763 [Penicillium canescens]KAJ6001911.1 hypothetical protein N7522_007138 [Penicillium canescens]KAJ6035003.1 hypothetical protein N7460_009178 [Penicillium canescens]KAJ6046666.1 hypothetical protein N7444_007920 [Penicillium canescens]KAJ6053751.1 hypothetical protein N7446_009763 [Penicillium canescens]KAJ6097847.1 hypothetical protein N7499_002221 [Penicillium canescens]
MVNTTIDSNPLDPNYVERRSSLDANDQSQRAKAAGKGMDIFVDRNVAPSPHTMCSELAHQHALEHLQENTEHWSQKEMAEHSNLLSDPTADRGFQAHPEELGE